MITIKEYTDKLEIENKTLHKDKNYWKKLAEKRSFQLQQKENIIKEVREYIEKNSQYDDNVDDYWTTINELLEILDKEVN